MGKAKAPNAGLKDNEAQCNCCARSASAPRSSTWLLQMIRGKKVDRALWQRTGIFAQAYFRTPSRRRWNPRSQTRKTTTISTSTALDRRGSLRWQVHRHEAFPRPWPWPCKRVSKSRFAHLTIVVREVEAKGEAA